MPEILGVWRLLECRATDPAGNAIPPQYGPAPMGVVTFTPERMMAALGDSRVAMPEGAPPRFYMSYTGPWSFDGQELVTIVDGTSSPDRMGSAQVRKVHFEGDRMVLAPPARMVGGVLMQMELVWEKLA